MAAVKMTGRRQQQRKKDTRVFTVSGKNDKTHFRTGLVVWTKSKQNHSIKLEQKKGLNFKNLHFCLTSSHQLFMSDCKRVLWLPVSDEIEEGANFPFHSLLLPSFFPPRSTAATSRSSFLLYDFLLDSGESRFTGWLFLI
jgi:hypothetical protein